MTLLWILAAFMLDQLADRGHRHQAVGVTG